MITAMCFKASMKKKECLIIAHVLIVETEAADRCRHPPISSSFLSSIPYSLFRVLLLFYLLTHLFRSSLPSLCFFSGCLYFFFLYTYLFWSICDSFRGAHQLSYEWICGRRMLRICFRESSESSVDDKTRAKPIDAEYFSIPTTTPGAPEILRENNPWKQTQQVFVVVVPNMVSMVSMNRWMNHFE